MRPLHAQQFLLLHYRLSVMKMILIYGLITTQIEIVTMQAHEFDKSTVTLLTSTLQPTKTSTEIATTNVATKKPTKTTKTKTTLASIMLLNRTSSAIFMSDDTVVDTTLVSKAGNNIKNNNNTDNCTNVAINVNVNNFQIGTAYESNHIANAQTLVNAVVKRKRWIRDLLATTTTTKNTTEIMSTTKTTSTTTTTTTSTVKNTPSALTLSSEKQNNSFITPILSTKSELELESTLISTFTNNSKCLELPQQQSKICKQPKETRILSRRKRFLAFPEGSSFSVTVCITIGVIGNPYYSYLAFGINWGVAYDLPNTSWVLNHLHGFSRHPVPATIMRRRTRRALYGEIEALVDIMGYNGRDCILRALCESKQYFSKNKLSMVGEMLRSIFSLPKQRLFTRELHENSEIKLYDHAYRRTRDIDCSEQYDCTFSLLELAFGKYSTPPPGYYN